MTPSASQPETQPASASFEAIAESIPHMVWLADAVGSVDYLNERAAAFTGLPREANYGWRWLELVHPDDAERARLGWDHATRTLTPFELSYRIRRSDGEYRWLSLRALPVRGQGGAIMRWLGTADDPAHHAGPVGDEARVELQVAQLRAMLQTIQPVERDRFGFVEPAERAARVESALRSDDGADRQGRGADQGGAGGANVAPRELAVGRLIADGYTNAEIANLLGLSLRSVESSRARLRQTLDLRSRAEIIRYFRGSVSPDPGG